MGKKSDIKVDLFIESEIKITLERVVSKTARTFNNVANTFRTYTDALWNSFCVYRARDIQPKDGFPLESIDPDTPPRIPERTKPTRNRIFHAVVGDVPHPKDLEIRQEEKNGKLVTMIKIGNGATPENPVINRLEIEITSPKDTPMTEILAAAQKEEYPEGWLAQERLQTLVNAAENEQLVPGIRTVSDRHKLEKIIAPVEGWEHILEGLQEKYPKKLKDVRPEDLTVEIEFALDRMRGETAAGQEWKNDQIEAEIKNVFLKGRSIIDDPKNAGFTEDALREIKNLALMKEHRRLTEFLENGNMAYHIQMQSGVTLPEGCGVTPKSEFGSKSLSGLTMLQEAFSNTASRGCDALIYCRSLLGKGYHVIEALSLCAAPR